MAPINPVIRDLRLDFFRGLSLWFIFIDHVPSNTMGWLTVRNFGFSDAAEIFVFISGYTAAFVYGPVMRERGFVVGTARILKRAWQIYVAFVFLSVIYIAEIAYIANSFENPLFAEEMDVLHFLQKPEVVLVEVLRLRFLLPNVDVLPLYIVLMLWLPPMLWLILRSPYLALGISIAIYAAAKAMGWNLTLYPLDRVWFFNPFAWQLLFLAGAWCAVGGVKWLTPFLRSNILTALCVLYLLFALSMHLTWFIPAITPQLPNWLLIFPLDKTGLSPLRFAHFFALAILVVRFVPVDAVLLRSLWAQPLIMCGRHSLEVFCLGVFLSFTAHFMLVEVSGRVAMQVFVSLSGILIMVALAGLMSWYKNLDRRAQQKTAA
ncbi:MAG: OpgC domain-containing protein [Xanthobacteraceae bacterium]|nr:OpgC domain-containing protein [Xanthobacteraceae bacterium]